MAQETWPRSRIRGIIFDLDGTVIEQDLDFEAIRREIGLPSRAPLLEALDAMVGDQLERARAVLERHERLAALNAVLNPGVASFLAWLDRREVRRGLLSRNSRACIEFVLGRLGLAFHPIVAREDAPYKPSPEGVWQICKAWQLVPEEVMVVGDYIYDIQAGKNAGARTALITHGRELPFADQADLVFHSFEEIPDVLRGWIGTLQ